MSEYLLSLILFFILKILERIVYPSTSISSFNILYFCPLLILKLFFWVALINSECCIQDQVSSYLTLLEYLGYLTPLLYLLLTSLTKSMREVPPPVHIFFFSVIISVIIFIITKVPECHPSLIKSEAQGSRTQNQSLLEDNQMALYRRQGSRPFPWKRNAKKSKMAVWGGLTNSCEKKRSKKQRRKGKIQTSECRVPKNSKKS